MRLFFWKMIIQTKLVLFWNSNWNKEIEQSVDLCYSDDKIIIKINIFSFLLPNLGADFFRKFLHIKILLLLRAAESEQKIASMIGLLRLSLVLPWILLGGLCWKQSKRVQKQNIWLQERPQNFSFLRIWLSRFRVWYIRNIFSTTPKYFNKNLLTRFELNSQIFNVD